MNDVRLNLPGVATHLLVPSPHGTVAACGLVAPRFTASDPSRVDCRSCRRTRVFRAIPRAAKMPPGNYTVTPDPKGEISVYGMRMRVLERTS